MNKTPASLFTHPFFDRLGIFLVCSMFVSALLFLGYQVLKKPLQEDDLKTVAGTLLEDPQLSPDRRHSSASVKLKLTAYPEVLFSVSGATYYAMFTEEFIRDVHQGDSIRIKIAKKTWQKRISAHQPPDIFEKLGNGGRIPVYGVVSKNAIYLHPDDAQSFSVRDNSLLIVMIVVFGIFLFIDVRNDRKKKSRRQQFR